MRGIMTLGNKMRDEELFNVISHIQSTGGDYLNLSARGLTRIPPQIGKLESLKVLELNHNKLTELPDEITLLHNLVRLDLGSNLFSELPLQITSLSNLKVLDLRDNTLKTLPGQVSQLVSLQFLDLKKNAFFSFPLEVCRIPSLRTLDLSDNRVVSLPKQIEQLTTLQQLHIRGNQLNTVPAQIGKLTDLFILDLQNNQLLDLPDEIAQLKQLWKLTIDGNPLPVSPELLAPNRNPAELIHSYLQHVRSTVRKRPLNEAKILIVGQAGVGKSSLAERLIEDSYEPHKPKTEGIDVKIWNININDNHIRLNVWDFGGQEIMHATHQFFLTRRSLYILVLDSRLDEQENRVEYWLKIIQSFGAGSPVIVVCNKCDQQAMDLDWKGLERRHPSIRGFVRRVSCETEEGIPELRSLIEYEVNNLDHIHDMLLPQWFAVKQALQELDHDYISYSEYKDICNSNNILDDLGQRSLIAFLHDIGVVLHFRDHPILEDTNVLSPKWVTRAVYKILNSRYLFDNKGVLEREALVDILDPMLYPREKHTFIIDMMRKFELSFQFEGYTYGNDKYLVPDLLYREEPDTGTWNDSLAFQYQYDVLPGSVISRFIVRMHKYISMDTYWRNGVVLAYKSRFGSSRALIKATLEGNKVTIHVQGDLDDTHGLLTIIRSDFERIHETISGLTVKEVIPIPGTSGVAIDYEDLKKLKEKGIENYYYPSADMEINVKELLEKYQPNLGSRRTLDKDVERDKPNQAPSSSLLHSLLSWEKLLAFGFGVILIAAFMVLALKFPTPTTFQYTIFRIIMALAAAGIGAIIPGFIEVEVQKWLRAGGAMALFVVVYFFCPAQLVSNPSQDNMQNNTFNVYSIYQSGDSLLYSSFRYALTDINNDDYDSYSTLTTKSGISKKEIESYVVFRFCDGMIVDVSNKNDLIAKQNNGLIIIPKDIVKEFENSRQAFTFFKGIIDAQNHSGNMSSKIPIPTAYMNTPIPKPTGAE